MRSDSQARFRHILRLSDSAGLFEHAEGAIPRRNHGYCVDDVGRGLVVLGREAQYEAEMDPELHRLAEVYLAFIAHAQTETGAMHNRLSFARRWLDGEGSGDWWGRALWGLGTVAARWGTEWMRAEALRRFELGARCRSTSRRATAMAAMGAAEVLAVQPGHEDARQLLSDAAEFIGPPRNDKNWPWPEQRLFYANAVFPEVLLAAGSLLSQDQLVEDGLRLLSWLLDRQTRQGHLSVTPVGGWAAGDPRPGFDQQPIEVAGLADAFARAEAISGDRVWTDGIRMCLDWFGGANDVGAPMMSPDTGGGFDGLGRKGPSINQGAESTLALVSTLQHGLRLEPIA